MLDKTKNLFTCDQHGNRYEVCHHVRAWVKKEVAASYDKGYENGYWRYRDELATLLDTKPRYDSFFVKSEIKRQMKGLK